MALPTKGKISVEAILREMGRANTKISLNELAELWYFRTRKAKFATARHNLSDWHGESWLNYGYGYYRKSTAVGSQIKYNDTIGEF